MFENNEFLGFEIIPFGGFNFILQEDEDSGNENTTNTEGENEKLPSDDDTDASVSELAVEKIADSLDELSEMLSELEKLDLYFNQDVEEQAHSKPKGGGNQLNITKVSSNYKIKAGLERLSNGTTFRKKTEGNYTDAPKLVKNLLNFKYSDDYTHGLKPKCVYFFVDTSGSVFRLASLILTLINSTVKSNQIKVFSGSEAHPNKNEKNGEIYSTRRKDFLDEELKVLFKKELPSDDTVMVFWGDLQCAGIRPKQLREILKKYKPIWLHSNDYKSVNYWDESEECAKVMPVYYGANTVSRFINKLKKI